MINRLFLTAFVFIGALPAHSATLSVIGTLNAASGYAAEGDLAIDSSGNLIGIASQGGSASMGTVFELVRSGTTYAAPRVLASFTAATGSASQSNAIAFDASGNLIGTAFIGGSSSTGSVFEIAKSGSSYGAFSTIATFATASLPVETLISDSTGNLYGATVAGGANNAGSVFEVPKSGGSYGSIVTLASLTSAVNGSSPRSGLIADAAGDLFGTASSGGPGGKGTVFELVKSGTSYGAPVVLASFSGTNGNDPFGAMVADAAGDIFGTTLAGGSSSKGTVFEIAKTGSTYGTVATIATFTGTANGASPHSLIIDAAGDLFGTASSGGASNTGLVFEVPNSGGTYGPLSTVASFGSSGPSEPLSGLVADSSGNLFGTTYASTAANTSAVYEITGSGYVVNAPEPASLALLGSGVVWLGAISRRRR